MINHGLVEKVLTAKQVRQYLERLNYHGQCRADIQTLTCLHQAHMENVPFENLDIVLGRKINLSPDALFTKVVTGKRGGFCYEVNSLFASLLAALGFEVYLHAARVHGDKGFGRPFDHMLLSVCLDKALYLADVGFGDSFIQPLRLMQGDDVYAAEQPDAVSLACLNLGAVSQREVNYKVVNTADGLVLMQQKPSQTWQAQYLFSLQAFEISAFYDMCQYHQTSPQSSFTQKSLCSVATPAGRKTMSNGRFIETVNHLRQESACTEQDRYREMLKQHFRLTLPQEISVQSWQKLLA
ncbi:arylamine N-acetyltransferase family protein [Thalassomonas actiniarum]|uniref:Arylamine N-acetyltransferase n=1 Tax=Thalassomonas actiniarum TaxID=485447 RepID=A0AAE9YVG8_9GAMM|nr:arylamine N-acetyltransferase [Thalassomonas actiniarum]WDE01578.1 arylamine N-acetyltransferase [Thalassomonas actiniarum]